MRAEPSGQDQDEDPEVVVGHRRGATWVRVSRGLHRRADVADPGRADLLAWQAVLPAEAAFSALTAAHLRGWDLPPLPTTCRCAPPCPTARPHPYAPGSSG
jgi:hypothetical protein